MKIIATSDGIQGEHIKAVLSEFIAPGSGPEATIAICYNAMKVKIVRRAYSIAPAVSFREMGYSTICIDLVGLSADRLSELLSSFHNLYVGHGDTRRLLRCWDAAGYGSVLLEHVRQHEGTLIGKSAGSILYGASIKTADYLGDSQSVRLDSLEGLGLFSDKISLFVHGNPDKEELIRTAVQEMRPYSQVVVLADGEAYVKYADGSERKIVS